jgi:tetratricopeptide (TPR) repeat protein
MRLYGLALSLMIACCVVSPLSASLPKPAKVDVTSLGSTPIFRWDEVEGAALYRVAVFAAPDEEGKRAIMAAVWIKGLSWAYAKGKVLPKAGKLPSTPAKALTAGADYKVMVRAADEEGANMSEWVSASFVAPLIGSAQAISAAAQAALSATASPSMTQTPAWLPVSATASATPTPTAQVDAKGATGPAELEVDLAGDFKETPEAGEGGLSKTAAVTTLEGARALLQQGKADDAEAAYRALLNQDATNADYWEGLGDSYDARNMKIEAKEAYEKALAIDGKRARLLKWMDDNVKK